MALFASLPTIGLLFSVFFLLRWISNQRRRSLSFLRGPTAPSWLFGNELQLNHQREVGKLEVPWFEEYGGAFRSTGVFKVNHRAFTIVVPTYLLGIGTAQEHILNVADPKALQHILHTSTYHYPKTEESRKITRRLFGRAIIWAEGNTHQRHRKALNPAFSASQLKTFLSLFQRSTQRLSNKWRENIFKDSPKGSNKEINVMKWLPNLTLDVIGESAFDYNFGALDEEDNALADTLRHLFDDTFGVTKLSMIGRAIRHRMTYDPTFHNPFNPDKPIIITKEDKRLNSWLEISKDTARDILKKKAGSDSSIDSKVNEGGKDILSVLVRSNMMEDPNKRLDDEEVLSQMATIILAGHETTASTTTWLLYELARHPEYQQKIRGEIDEIRDRKDEGEELNSNDYDSMVYFNAAIKETLRVHPIVGTLSRYSDRHDVIPLSEPVISASGEKLTQIPVQKGQRINFSIFIYNRLKSVWGADADVWNPERFLDIKKGTTLGVYANLMTFSAGVRACIGWRFALQELQAILAGLLTNFEFSVDPHLEVFPANMGLRQPVIRGRETEGPIMPLKVKVRG
ncbi:hypothetical protein D9758_003717 [Tetrapyrgos nigripes]|uniref:Cytochrome P450 n=1 Tax=Tetrapyrgos nigripes TaxID=182062 RepID=A0A8H5GM50_9AGAR|nr:hypothetical protein D9758_003717 [Tetrapyrgos nigripes]